MHLPKSNHLIFATQIEFKLGFKLLYYPIDFAMVCAMFLQVHNGGGILHRKMGETFVVGGGVQYYKVEMLLIEKWVALGDLSCLDARFQCCGGVDAPCDIVTQRRLPQRET